MALRKFPFRPGVVKDDTAYSAMGFAVDSDRVRFKRGRVETMEGYEDATLAGQRMAGVCRTLYPWTSNAGLPYLACGTSSKLYVYQDTQIFDVTPFRATGSLNGPIQVSAGSPKMSVAHPNHGAKPGDTVYLHAADVVGATSVGRTFATADGAAYVSAGSPLVTLAVPGHGLVGQTLATVSGVGSVYGANLNGTWTVWPVDADTIGFQVDASPTATGFGGVAGSVAVYGSYPVVAAAQNSYVVDLPSGAPIDGSGGGETLYAYEMAAGNADGSSAGGFGAGGFGLGPYGYSAAPEALVAYKPRTWCFDSFGEYLTANPVGGTIYVWQLNVSRRAEPMPNAPAVVFAHLVTWERAVMALGCSDIDGNFDPMLVRWTRVSAFPDYSVWMPSDTNTAGFIKVTGGAYLVAGRKTKDGYLVWTDTGLQFGAYQTGVAPGYVFEPKGTQCGLMGPNAVVEKDGSAYWMTPAKTLRTFTGGSVAALESPCRRYVADALPDEQGWKVFCAYDDANQGVMWHYPHGQSEVNRYLRCDLRERTDATASEPEAGWSVGTFPMTAWVDRAAQPFPFSARADGMLCRQGVGLSDAGGPRTVMVEWAPLEIPSDQGEAGTRVLNVTACVSDALVTGAVGLTVTARRFPNGPVFSKGPYPQALAASRQALRMQGRQIGFKFSGTGTTVGFRFGDVRYDVSDGPRR